MKKLVASANDFGGSKLMTDCKVLTICFESKARLNYSNETQNQFECKQAWIFDSNYEREYEHLKVYRYTCTNLY